jgi:hypothetical protein
MPKANVKQLQSVLEMRFDHYSARAVLAEALERTGLADKEQFETAELVRLAELLAGLRTRMEWVAAEVLRLSGEGEVPAKTAAATGAAPAAAPAGPPPSGQTEKRAEGAEAQAAPDAASAAEAAERKKAGKKAKATPFDVKAGSTGEHRAPAQTALRIQHEQEGVVRWGVNGWKTPDEKALPPGTQPVAGELAVETRLGAGKESPFELLLGPFGPEVQRVDFVVRTGEQFTSASAVLIGQPG